MTEFTGKVIKKNQIVAPFLGARLSFIQGQDPMGMLNVGEQVFSMILPGLNNVTERIRYYSFYCWFFGTYAKWNGSEDPKEQRKFIRRAEYLLALVAAKKDLSGIAGITEARKNYDPSKSVFSLKEGTGELKNSTENTYWKNPRGVFGQNYVSSLRQIGLIRDKGEETGVFIRTAFEIENVVTGKDLENAFIESTSQNNRELFLKCVKSGEISNEDLVSISDDFQMIEVPTNKVENKLLLNMLVSPDSPTSENKTFFRKNTIRLYLNQLDKNNTNLSVIDFVDNAYRQKGKDEKSADPTLLAWYYYQLSQYWHIVSTSCLCHLLNALQNFSGSGWIEEYELVRLITDDALKELKKLVSLDNSTLFTELSEPEDEALTISRNTITKNYSFGLANAFLLLRKIIIENSENIQELKDFSKKHMITSNSDFVASYDDLLEKSNLAMREFIHYFLVKYVINRHQIVALNKMNDTQSTEKFLREDGYIRFVESIDYGFSSPRLGNLIQFLNDLDIISNSGNLTSNGMKLSKDLNE